ncbi:uncharacterized protein J4E79_011262 [Alternaria viburni]|uniref:uncharacterized protein n=1 Tax=Alternaria viburni TaxID=566460 RepID=UPI0020C2835D|nr:uncharacterized protein J4E79_011262 [Alternaria viburni]KAI4643322.1 hypothetical protein J4E79_011262 [Alternaria viburni]
MTKDKQNTEDTDLDMAKIKYIRPSKSQEKKAAAPLVPEPEPVPDTSEMSDVPSNLDPELNDDDFNFADDGDEAEQQEDEAMIGEDDVEEDLIVRKTQLGEGEETGGDEDGREDAPMIDDDDSADSSHEETKQDLLDEIYKNWVGVTLRDTLQENAKESWLKRNTNLRDTDWNIETLRAFRDLSRLTKNDHDKAKAAVAKRLGWRKHRDKWERTGETREVKEQRLRDDVNAICAELRADGRGPEDDDGDEGEGEDDEPKEGTKKKAKKATKGKEGAAGPQPTRTPRARAAKARNDGTSSAQPGKAAKRQPRTMVGEDNDGLNTLGEAADDEDYVNGKPSKKQKKNDQQVASKRNTRGNTRERELATERRQQREERPSTRDNLISSLLTELSEDAEVEQQPDFDIRTPTQRHNALRQIYSNWGITSLLDYLGEDLQRSAAVRSDNDINLIVITRILHLSNMTNTREQGAAVRQEFARQLSRSKKHTTDTLLAVIARVTELYRLAAQLANNTRLPSAQTRTTAANVLAQARADGTDRAVLRDPARPNTEHRIPRPATEAELRSSLSAMDFRDANTWVLQCRRRLAYLRGIGVSSDEDESQLENAIGLRDRIEGAMDVDRLRDRIQEGRRREEMDGEGAEERSGEGVRAEGANEQGEQRAPVKVAGDGEAEAQGGERGQEGEGDDVEGGGGAQADGQGDGNEKGEGAEIGSGGEKETEQ